MRRSKLEQLRDQKRKEMKPTTLNSVDEFFKLMLTGDLNPTQKAFIYSPDRIKAYKGPAGCAKSATLCAAGLARAVFQPGSKGFISRHDYNDLQDTTKQEMTKLLNRLPKGMLLERDKSPPEKWWIASVPQYEKLPDGTTVLRDEPSQITFMGLKDDIVGIEANWWMVDEANEVDEVRIHQINTRLRAQGGNYMIGLAFNPPDKHHWLYTACTGRNWKDEKVAEPWMTLFEPQPRENVQNLPPNYYEDTAKTMPEDQRQRYIEGQWGSTFEGQPVYREFRFNVHTRADLEYNPNAPLHRLWDFGYNHPVCLFSQFDWQGRLHVLYELQENRKEASEFARLVKQITAQKFPNAPDIVDYGDPAVAQHKDTGRTLSVLLREGITMRYITTHIEVGVQLLRQRFNLMIEGEPAIVIHRNKCPLLISALRGGYRMDDKGQKPFKDGFYDHVCDALRYGAVNFWGAGTMTHRQRALAPMSVEYNSAFDNVGTLAVDTGD